jgi:hypothetical protein
VADTPRRANPIDSISPCFTLKVHFRQDRCAADWPIRTGPPINTVDDRRCRRRFAEDGDMAVKKGVSRSSSSGSSAESNTGLVVSLVIFILLTIGLGVTTYLGFAGQEDYKKQADDQKQQADAAKKKAQAEEAQKLALRLAMGIGDASDKTAFSAIKTSGGADLSAQVAKISDAISGNLRAMADNPALVELIPRLKDNANAKWDVQVSDTPAKTFAGLVDDMTKAFKAQLGRHQANTVTHTEDKSNLDRRIQELEGKVAEANTALKKAHDDLVRVQNEKAESAVQASNKIKQLSEQVALVTNEKDNLNAAMSADLRRRDLTIDSMTKVRDNFRSRVGPILEHLEKIKLDRPEIRELAELHELLLKQFESVQALSNDTPKGTIVKIDRVTGTVYVNLGSADYIRPGVTFSVLPAGSTGKAAASRERKGAIEIVAILEPHLSAAKLVEATNAVRDPMLPGDLLFNPAWNPNQREHVAIAGIIDINGDGIDDTQQMIRDLERQGVVVDAFLDLKERAIKGPGISEKTTYLILGEKPVLPPNVQLDNNPLTQAALDVIGKMEEMKNKTKELGGQSVNYRRFLTLMGFKLPKGMDNQEISASSYLRGTQSKGLDDGSTKPDIPK